MAYSLTWLSEVLLAAGLKVAEQPGWIDRGTAEMGTVKGVICHHTAGPRMGNMPSLGIITNGRPDLNGPLAQLGLGRDGTYYLVAAGRANHAGSGTWQGITTGNSSFIGIEAENAGTPDDPWPAVQLDAYRHGITAILNKIGANSSMCCGHKEYALPVGRKTDPSFPFEMSQFRDEIASIAAGRTPALPLIPANDGLHLTLRRGDSGDAVKLLQDKLGQGADGRFGPQTEVVVRDFQRGKRLVPDGIVGPKTWAALG
jgi:peptidoglycan hydrolase-like protein with peptidoglycan-binding domain